MEQGLALGGYSGVYDVTPDHQPVLGAIPEYAGLFANFGWSGHGFKHAPEVGRLLADVVLEASRRATTWSRSGGPAFATGRSCRRRPASSPPHPKPRTGPA